MRCGNWCALTGAAYRDWGCGFGALGYKLWAGQGCRAAANASTRRSPSAVTETERSRLQPFKILTLGTPTDRCRHRDFGRRGSNLLLLLGAAHVRHRSPSNLNDLALSCSRHWLHSAERGSRGSAGGSSKPLIASNGEPLPHPCPTATVRRQKSRTRAARAAAGCWPRQHRSPPPARRVPCGGAG